MRRARAFFVTLIIAAIAVRLVWAALAPLIPYAVTGVAVMAILGSLYFRRQRW